MRILTAMVEGFGLVGVEKEGEGPAGEADCRRVERCEKCKNERERHEDQGNNDQYDPLPGAQMIFFAFLVASVSND
jgi:hypothetical protein